MSIKNECEIRSDTTWQKYHNGQLIAIICSCRILSQRFIVLHSTCQSRDPQIIVQISSARACLFNWVKIGTKRIARSNNNRMDIPQWKPPAAALHGRDWLIPFPYWKIPCMLSRFGWRRVLICDFTIRDVVMPGAHYSIAVGNFISLREFYDARSSFLLCDIRKVCASECF